ncbi:hypothetical protein COV17_03555 [Candidatus Woesearchaeota archaeon CG10_big_fil_rev_8_21_14_0_10_36_11]|nr:MAG: hypothetical protein COV17_03555 [Candidatus Woesearchaeota archaeon CG10_big_fil_rev_8_21_14_0_10_36_11]
MKILFVCENYIPHYGGAEVVFKNIAEGYVTRGHTVALLTHQLKNTKEKEVMNSVKVYRVPSFFSRYVFTFSAIPNAIKMARQADIIQTTTFNGAVPAWIAAKLTGKKVVLTIHEVWIGKWRKNTGFPWIKSFIHECLERLIYMLPFDKYVCVSNATRNDLIRSGIKEKKTVTIYNGLDYTFWDPTNFNTENAKRIRKELGAEKKFVYFSWGRPGPSKGFEYVLKAVPYIKERLPNSLFLLMLGSIDKYKNKYQELRQLIKKLKIESYVKIVPSVPYEELGDYINAADCIVVPSLAEGFGYTTTESVAMHKPVIVSDAGSIPEVVSGKYLMFKSKDYRELAEKVIQGAKGKYNETPIRRFEWAPSIEKYLELYRILSHKN